MEIISKFFSWIFLGGDSINPILSIIVLLVGLVALYFGADFLIKGGVNIALASGVKKIVVGLTVVAFGTSLPEMVVSVTSTLSKDYGIAIGNIVGSNIANIALILGIGALIRPLEVEKVVLKFDMWVVLGVTFLFMFLSMDGIINLFEGIVLICTFIGYLIWISYTAKEHNIEGEVEEVKKGNIFLNILLIAIGLGMLVLGAQFSVKGGVDIAQALGIHPLIIGLTMIAVGTSLPELATTIVAQIRKESDISVGNIIGSNIFNILFIIGIAAVVAPFTGLNSATQGLEVSTDVVTVYSPIMLAVAIILLPLMATHNRISRKEGLFLLLGYVAYIAYIAITTISSGKTL